MAKINTDVIRSIRATAEQLENTNLYQWGHMGSCNCGFLAQQVTRLTKAEIHRRALMRYGDWSEQLNDYCPTSGLPFDDVITELLAAGFTAEDLRHLERLSDPQVLHALPAGTYLNHNIKADVVLYLRTWAGLIERELLTQIELPDLLQQPAAV